MKFAHSLVHPLTHIHDTTIQQIDCIINKVCWYYMVISNTFYSCCKRYVHQMWFLWESSQRLALPYHTWWRDRCTVQKTQTTWWGILRMIISNTHEVAVIAVFPFCYVLYIVFCIFCIGCLRDVNKALQLKLNQSIL